MKVVERTLKELLYIDRISGVYKREFLEDVKDKIKPDFGVIFIDIKDLNKINTTKGYVAGDLILKEVGSLLKEHDKFPIRYMGDKFVLIKNFIGETSVVSTKFLEISKEISNRLKSKGIELSIGVGLPLIGSDYTLDDLIDTACRAAYKAKKTKTIELYIKKNVIKEVI